MPAAHEKPTEKKKPIIFTTGTPKQIAKEAPSLEIQERGGVAAMAKGILSAITSMISGFSFAAYRFVLGKWILLVFAVISLVVISKKVMSKKRKGYNKIIFDESKPHEI